MGTVAGRSREVGRQRRLLVRNRDGLHRPLAEVGGALEGVPLPLEGIDEARIQRRAVQENAGGAVVGDGVDRFDRIADQFRGQEGGGAASATDSGMAS